MLQVSEIINRIRSLTHDNSELGWNDDEVLNVINAGCRFINRMIKDIKPSMLADESFKTTLLAKNNKVKLPDMAIRILYVYANDIELKAMNRSCYNGKLNEVSTPNYYYLNNFDTIVIWPMAQENTEIEVIYIPDSKELGLEDNTPFPNDFDDALMEYVVIRLAMANEFDISQETVLMQAVVSQVEALLNLYDDGIQHSIAGYWDGYDNVAVDVHKSW